MKLLIGLLSLIIISSASYAQSQPRLFSVEYRFMLKIPKYADQPVTSFSQDLKKIFKSLSEATKAQGVFCNKHSLSEITTHLNDVGLTGSYVCYQSSWNQIQNQKIRSDFKKVYGIDILILPPPGGGATISN